MLNGLHPVINALETRIFVNTVANNDQICIFSELLDQGLCTVFVGNVDKVEGQLDVALFVLDADARVDVNRGTDITGAHRALILHTVDQGGFAYCVISYDHHTCIQYALSDLTFFSMLHSIFRVTTPHFESII